MSDVTHLLAAAAAGDPKAAAELLPLVYNELRKLAAGGIDIEVGSVVYIDAFTLANVINNTANYAPNIDGSYIPT